MKCNYNPNADNKVYLIHKKLRDNTNINAKEELEKGNIIFIDIDKN